MKEKENKTYITLNFDVIKNLFDIINKLPNSLYKKLDDDDIYTTTYGTIIVDWKNKNNILSLEVGYKSFGYFIEIKGEYETVDEVPCDDENVEELIKKITDFYLN